MKSLYIVWCPTGGNPSVRHLTQDEATTEAKRLALLNKDKEFFVMRAVSSHRSPTCPIISKNYCKA